MIVDRALIPDSMVIPGSSGSLQMLDHTLIDVPLANVYLVSPYYKGYCKVMCVSSSVYPVIIGNVRGARQMLPDPKADNQKEAQVWTSGGNNNDDDNQGDMPSWMFRPTEERLSTETQRKRQPRSRRMITVLLKKFKSQKASQKESVLLECMQEISRLLSIKGLTSMPYHPICNGLVERWNGTLKSMLTRLCQDQPKQ